MSGTASQIQMTFLQRVGNTYAPYATVPIASSFSYTTDVRQFSGSFDLQLALGSTETFSPQSHDVVEFWTMVNGVQTQLGVGFLEDEVDDSDERQSDLKFNGRELIGQLIYLLFKSPNFYEKLTIEGFVRQALVRDGGTYLNDYLNFRGRGSNLTNNQGAYPAILLVATNIFLKKGAVIQNYAELAMNLVYQNPKGQVEIYGRSSDPSTGVQTGVNPLGILTIAPGRSNVSKIRRTNNFSKVFSEYVVAWVDAQKNTDYNSLISQIIKNTDPRVTGIYQPGNTVFSASDIRDLAGNQSPQTRVKAIAKSAIRKSMSNVGALTVVTEEPFYTDPKTGVQTAFRTMQDWQIQDPAKGIDKACRIAGISYTQNEGNLEVQLAFVEPDTFV